MTAALLRAEGLRVGAYISPHVRGWSERIQVDGADADLDAALARVRPHADGRDAVRGADRRRARRVRRARGRRRRRRGGARRAARRDERARRAASSCSRTSRSSTPTCSATTREAIAAEKLAVDLAGRARRPRRARVGAERRARPAPAASRSCRRLEPRARASRRPRPSSAGRSIPPRPRRVRVPGRLERRSEQPARDLGRRAQPRRDRLPARRAFPTARYTIVASILADKEAEEMLRALDAARRHAVATSSPNPRAIPAEELAAPRRAALRARRGGRRSRSGARPRAQRSPGRMVPFL